MAYHGKEYPEALNDGAAQAYVVGGVIVETIPVKQTDLLSVFVKLSAGTLTHLEVYESIDGSDWRNATALAAYQSSSVWSVITFDKDGTFPAGTLLQLRCKTSGVTVDKVIVVQNW